MVADLPRIGPLAKDFMVQRPGAPVGWGRVSVSSRITRTDGPVLDSAQILVVERQGEKGNSAGRIAPCIDPMVSDV